jgi:5-methylcytosine-specific restriction endonuclease McrA
MQRITRKAAKAAGLKYYFTGKPCKRGHIDKRFVCSFCCMTCAREKAAEAFRGLVGEAREARRNYERRRWQDPVFRQWAATYRAEHAVESASYRQARKEAQPDYFRDHYAKNAERRKAQSLAWYRANTERALQRQKEYTASRPIELRRANGRRRRGTRRAIEKRVFVEAVDSRTVFERDKGQCGICMKPVDPASNWEIDHIMPISKGGPHSYANVQLAHRKCNRSKAARV